MNFGEKVTIGTVGNMKTEVPIFFNYDCGICGKHTDKKFPVSYLNKPILVCETCLSFIKDNKEFSTFKVVKK